MCVKFSKEWKTILQWWLRKLDGCDLLMPAKIRSADNLSLNAQEAVITTYICVLTNFTELKLTNIQINYWWGQRHCGPSDQNLGGPWLTGPTLQHPRGNKYKYSWNSLIKLSIWTNKLIYIQHIIETLKAWFPDTLHLRVVWSGDILYSLGMAQEFMVGSFPSIPREPLRPRGRCLSPGGPYH